MLRYTLQLGRKQGQVCRHKSSKVHESVSNPLDIRSLAYGCNSVRSFAKFPNRAKPSTEDH
jgi:hypothetical protein